MVEVRSPLPLRRPRAILQNKTRRTMIFQRTATTSLTPCLNPRVQSIFFHGRLHSFIYTLGSTPPRRRSFMRFAISPPCLPKLFPFVISAIAHKFIAIPFEPFRIINSFCAEKLDQRLLKPFFTLLDKELI